MKVGLFVPCYIDQLYPDVGVHTLQLLEKLGVEVAVPENQTCCGQPLANSGMESETIKICKHFIDLFKDFDTIVSPSSSCVLHIKEHVPKALEDHNFMHVHENIFELTDFLVEKLGIQTFTGHFPFKVGLHKSCHGLRGLRNGKSSELAGNDYSRLHNLLCSIDGIQMIELDRQDECCGFGGTFSVFEEAVSVHMGKNRVEDHLRNGTEIITATDMSCLMHMEGLILRKKDPIQVMHIAQVLNLSLS